MVLPTFRREILATGPHSGLEYSVEVDRQETETMAARSQDIPTSAIDHRLGKFLSPYHYTSSPILTCGIIENISTYL